MGEDRAKVHQPCHQTVTERRGQDSCSQSHFTQSSAACFLLSILGSHPIFCLKKKKEGGGCGLKMFVNSTLVLH